MGQQAVGLRALLSGGAGEFSGVGAAAPAARLVLGVVRRGRLHPAPPGRRRGRPFVVDGGGGVSGFGGGAFGGFGRPRRFAAAVQSVAAVREVASQAHLGQNQEHRRQPPRQRRHRQRGHGPDARRPVRPPFLRKNPVKPSKNQ